MSIRIYPVVVDALCQCVCRAVAVAVARTHARTYSGLSLSVWTTRAILLYFRFLPPFSPVAGRMQVAAAAASSLFFFSARVPRDGNFVRWVVFFFLPVMGFTER